MLGASLPYQVRRCAVPDDPFLTRPMEPVNRFFESGCIFLRGWGWLGVGEWWSIASVWVEPFGGPLVGLTALSVCPARAVADWCILRIYGPSEGRLEGG